MITTKQIINKTNISNSESEIFDLKNQFKKVLSEKLSTNDSQLLNIKSINIERCERVVNIKTTDSSGIIELNNVIFSERKSEFMQSVLNQQDSLENRLFLINDSSELVKNYINIMLLRASNDINITDVNLYMIGNIFLYSIVNVDVETFHDVLDMLRETMFIYNSNKTLSITVDALNNYTNFSNELELSTGDESQECLNEFYKKTEEKTLIHQNKKNLGGIILTGSSIITSIILTSIGLPPLGSFITKFLITSSDGLISSIRNLF